MEQTADKIILWLQHWGLSETLSLILFRAGVIFAMILTVYLLDRISRRILIPIIRKITARTETKWDDYILSDEVLNVICRLISPIVIYILLPLVLTGTGMLDFLLKVCRIYMIGVFMKLLFTVITSVYTMSNEYDRLKNHSLKGFYQMLKLAVIFIGSILIISEVIDKSPVVLLTGLGAGTAILMLVFQDTIKGFVAGIQLIANDMLHPGDWITMPKYGADGDVIEVSLTTVKVQNWDKTITTIPPYALVSDSFQNWRGMQESGGRRVKRAVYIDMRSIQFCTEDQMKEFEAKGWFDGVERVDGFPVNLHIFRNYLEKYLRNHPRVNQNMTIMVRQLQPTAQGLPLELYFFSDGTAWIPYEQLQSEIFEHVFAMLPTFGLRIFQSPMGIDFSGESFS